MVRVNIHYSLLVVVKIRYLLNDSFDYEASVRRSIHTHFGAATTKSHRQRPRTKQLSNKNHSYQNLMVEPEVVDSVLRFFILL
jgi:hypothetical protein